MLLALDARLGWRADMRRELARHRAGAPLVPAAHAMFRPMTDDESYSRFRTQLLEVATDRIAHTAHAAQRLLPDLRPASIRKGIYPWWGAHAVRCCSNAHGI